MKLASLRVIHLAKGQPGQPGRQGIAAALSQGLAGALFLDSCQRWLWVCHDLELDGLDPAVIGARGIEVFEGTNAYQFLLRVSTGLESQVVGETDIFGQLKEAWRKRQALSSDLDWLMQRLFEDTKDIRSRYLQNLGGASYGSLVRMMLKQSPGPRLLVGAGQLAQSVAPYLLDRELWLVNRSAESLRSLYADLCTRAAEQGQVVSQVLPRIRVIAAEDEERAWREAASVVVCIPMDAVQDSRRVGWREGREGPVIHLGGLLEAAGAWTRLPEFSAQDDLFALQKAQGDVRLTQVTRALRACDEKAKLRALGPSVSIPHGWEDLAVFA